MTSFVRGQHGGGPTDEVRVHRSDRRSAFGFSSHQLDHATDSISFLGKSRVITPISEGHQSPDREGLRDVLPVEIIVGGEGV